MLEIQRSIVIQRPVELVQAQFADVGYHQRRGHHRGTEFTVVEDTPPVCRYEQGTRIGPLRVRQQFRLRRGDPALQVNELLAGAFAPGSITFAIEATQGSDDATVVTATLRSDRGGPARFLRPILRAKLGRSLAQALDEDRIDLESGNYAAGE